MDTDDDSLFGWGIISIVVGVFPILSNVITTLFVGGEIIGALTYLLGE